MTGISRTRCPAATALRGLLAALLLATTPVGVAAEGEALPTDPFGAPGDTANPPSIQQFLDRASPSGADPQANATSSSLWDTFTEFFELGVPRTQTRRDRYRATLGVNGGYDDNVFTTETNQIGSLRQSVTGSLEFASGTTERLDVATALSGGATYYQDRPGDKTDINGTWSGRLAYSITRRLNVDGNFSLSYLSQPDPTLIGGVTRFNGDYFAFDGGLNLSYAIRPRLSVSVGFRSSSVQYTDETQNEQLGFAQQNYIAGLSYLVHPRVTLTLEYRLSPLRYEASDQDSVGQILALGFTAKFSPRLTWVFQAGVEARQLSNTTDGAKSEYIGPFLESRLEYILAPESSLVGSMRYGTEPSGVAGISIRETFRGTLSFRYTFAGRLTTDAGLSFQHDRFDQPGDNDYTQNFIVGTLGLVYRLNPALALTARYEYSTVDSELPLSDYVRNVTTLGVEIVF